MSAENKFTSPALMAVLLAVSMALLLFVVRAADVRPTKITRPPRIAFMTDRDGNFEIYIMEHDGGNPTNLTNDEAQDGLQTWSLGANAFAFITTRSGDSITLYRMDVDGGHPQAVGLAPPVDAGAPIWSPTGEWIAFGSGGEANPDVYLVDAVGEQVRNLTGHSAQDRFGAWSPDGQHLLFVSDRDGGNLVIYAIGVQGGEPTSLSDPASDSARPRWSPDGTKIAFMTNHDEDIEIYVMNADGGNVTRLTDSQGFDGFPAWSPDGKQIAFVSVRDGNPEIYLMNADGSEPKNLTNNPAQDSLEGDFAWSPDGAQSLFHSNRDGNDEVYVMNADGSQQSNLTNNPATDIASIWIP